MVSKGTIALYVLCLFCTSVLQACGTTSPVSQDINLATNYKLIQNFMVLDTHPLDWTGGEQQRLVTVLPDRERRKEIIRQSFQLHAWQEVDTPAQADILIALTYGDRPGLSLYRDYVRLGKRGWLWSTDPRDIRYGANSLAVDIFDARTGNAVWHGYANINSFANEGVADPLEMALVSILNEFPPDISKLRGKRLNSILVQ